MHKEAESAYSSDEPAQVWNWQRDAADSSRERARLVIDLDAIAHNFRLVEELCSGARVMPVVKGDAYGMSARAIARALEARGAAAFAVDNASEGIELRNAGIGAPILVLDGDVAENFPMLLRYNLTPGIATEKAIEALDAFMSSAARRWPIWLYYNCGFNRSGPRSHENFARLCERAKAATGIAVQALYSHLTDSHADRRFTRRQIERYDEALRFARGALGDDVTSSLFASHGILGFAHEYSTDWVRPGILLYGEEMLDETSADAATLERAHRLKPAISLFARMLHVFDAEFREPIGYGQRFVLEPGQRIGTVAIGYGLGYPPGAHRLPAIVGDRAVESLGAVGMDYLQLDLEGAPDAAVGDWVTLIGRNGDTRIRIKDLAERACSTPYVVMRALRAVHEYVSASQSEERE